MEKLQQWLLEYPDLVETQYRRGVITAEERELALAFQRELFEKYNKFVSQFIS